MTQDTGKHYLVIVVNQDDGEPGFEEWRDWHITHPPDCEKSMRESYDLTNPRTEYNLCPVEGEVIHNGLDSAQTEEGKEWTDLEDGSYEIEAWHEAVSTYGGMEYDGGLTIYPDRPGIMLSDHA